MFLATRTAARWRFIGIVLTVLVVGSWLLVRWFTDETHGGTPAGLVYGVVAAALVALLAFFGIRKRAYRSKLGTLEGWLHSHVVLGLLVVLVTLFHTGFRFQDGLAVTTFAVLVVVVLSGVVGVVLYASVPRVLTEVQSSLGVDELSERIHRLGASMARLASGRSPAFERVYRELVETARPGPFAGWKLLLRALPGSDRRVETRRSQLVARVPPEEEEPLRQLLVLGRQRQELLLRLGWQERYKNLLDAWLWIHLPLTVALIVLIVAHVVTASYFGDLVGGGTVAGGAP